MRAGSSRKPRRCRPPAIRAIPSTSRKRASCCRNSPRADPGNMAEVGGWILGGVRTPLAKAGGPLKRVPVYELGRIAIAELIARQELDPARLDHVLMGNCAMPAEAANTARVVALRAGIPEKVPAATVHRNCASGMEAVADGLYRIAAGDAKLVMAGGMESMSRIPLLYSYEYSDWLE